MNKYTLIESRLISVNDATFQRIGNAWLTESYKGDLQSPGTVSGKNKTRKGRPDSYLFGGEGKYLLAEFTTKDKRDSKRKFYQKLEEDLLSCLDFKKLGITGEQVNLIILCCNSKVDIDKENELRTIAKQHNIPVRVVGIDSLTTFLSKEGRIVAREFLEVPFDSGQLLTKSEFIKQYTKRNIATPLDNALEGREDDLKNVIKGLETNSITIVRGSPGVGKSRLVLEAIDRFTKKHSEYSAYYLFRKTGSITEDLITQLHPKRNYVLFVDDANQQLENFLDAIFQQIEREDARIKIIATVRDYALDMVLRVCGESKATQIRIEKLTDQLIAQIIRNTDFKIGDKTVIDRIVQISNGNPRLAIMAARAAKEGGIRSLKDVYSIYDTYFQTVFDHNPILGDKKRQSVIAVILFFKILDIAEETSRMLLKGFYIKTGYFIETIASLEQLEVVETFNKEVVKITDQVMSTYFFYRLIIKENILSFGELLTKYFEKYSWRFKDCFHSACNAFGPEEVLEKVKSQLTSYYNFINTNVSLKKIFLDVFGKFLPSYSFSFITAAINCQPEPVIKSYDLKNQSKSVFNLDNSILNLLGQFYNSLNPYELKTGIELTLQYIEKNLLEAGYVFKTLKESFAIGIEDAASNLKRQNIIYDYLSSRLSDGELHAEIFFSLFSETLLRTHYDEVFFIKKGDGFEFCESLRLARTKFWICILDNCDKYREIIYDLLIKYLDNSEFWHRMPLDFDLQYIMEIIEKKFKKDSFQDCYFVHQYLDMLNRKHISVKDQEVIKAVFSNETLKVFSSLAWDNDIWHKMEFQEEKVHEFVLSELTKNFTINSVQEFNILYRDFVEIVSFVYSSKFQVRKKFDILISTIFEKKSELAFQLLEIVLENENRGDIAYHYIFRSIFSLATNSHEKLLELIERFTFISKESWMDHYFWLIPEKYIDANMTHKFLAFCKDKKDRFEIYTGWYEKFKLQDDNIYYVLSKIMVEKRSSDDKYEYKIEDKYFSKNLDLVKKNYILCKQIYFQQEEMHHHFDQYCEDLFILFNHDESIILEYLDFLISKGRLNGLYRPKNLTIFWTHAEGQRIIKECLLYIARQETYFVDDSRTGMFFINLKSVQLQKKAFDLLINLIENFSANEIILNMVFEIARHRLKEFYYLLIQRFVELSQDLGLFCKIRWNNNHFSSNNKYAIWSEFREIELQRIRLSIMELPDPRLYIFLIEELDRQIASENKNTEWERKRIFAGY